MSINLPASLSSEVTLLAREVAHSGGRAFVVGGAVRDGLLDRPIVDVDVEVHALDVPRLREVLARRGSVMEVGKSFTVFKVGTAAGVLDVSLPRGESLPDGTGQVQGDPHIGLEKAARRRDLTINALAWDPLSEELIDPVGGLEDLRSRRLHAADAETFGHDPVRVWRVSRFAATLECTPSAELLEVCQSIPTEDCSGERVRSEIERMLLESERPSVGWAVATRVGLSGWLPKGTPHGLASLDRAALLRLSAGSPPRPLALMWAVLLLESGETAAERYLERLGVVRRRGFALRHQILGSISVEPMLREACSHTVLRELADRLEVGLACSVSEAFSPGGVAQRNGREASMLGIASAALPTVLGGADLRRLGVPAGPMMGKILQEVRRAQWQGVVSDRDSAIGYASRLWSRRRDEADTSSPGSE